MKTKTKERENDVEGREEEEEKRGGTMRRGRKRKKNERKEEGGCRDIRSAVKERKGEEKRGAGKEE